MSGPQWHDAAPWTCRSCGGVHDDPTILRELNKRAALREEVAARAAAPTEPETGSGMTNAELRQEYPPRPYVPPPDRGAGLTQASERLLRDFDRTPEAIDYSELSARLWLIEREAARAAAPTEPPKSPYRDADEHERQSLAGTHLFDAACYWCLLDHYEHPPLIDSEGLDVERQFDVVDKTLLVTFGWSDKEHRDRYALAAHNFLRRLQEVGWDVTITDPVKAAEYARLTRHPEEPA